MEWANAGRIVLDYAVKGGMIAAGAGMLLISLASAVGYLRQPPSERLLIVLGDYFLVGAILGGLVGLVLLLRERRRKDSP